ncbi:MULTISPECIES: hypothetical protein [Fervidobacterium]|nr:MULTISPECIES: hypothetical protein [Fervidobacterium]
MRMYRALVVMGMLLAIVGFSNLNFNITHLERLSEWFALDGEMVKGYWVYAENKGNAFIPVSALNEGDFCVDDVARVVLLYSEAYELTKDSKYLNLALDAAKFVVKMQASDGEFYNFAYKDGTINKYGITSQKSAGWWALRAFWGLSKLAKFTDDSKIHEAVKKTYNALKRKPPTSADQLALYILGLCNYYEVYQSSEVLKEINKYATDLLDYEIKNFDSLKGFFTVYKDRLLWNGWGNHYIEALLRAYKITGNEKFLSVAEKSLISQASIMISTGLIYSIQNYFKLYPELAYALECTAVPLVLLYDIEKDEKYALLSSLAISWLFGGNRLGVRMFGENGEGYDGMEYMHYNRNAGAESTICSLRTILHGMKLPETYQTLAMNPELIGRSGVIVLEAEAFDIGISSAKMVTGDYGSGASLQMDGKGRIRKQNIENGTYYILLSGNFSNTTITVSSKTSVKKDLTGKGLFEIGIVEIEGNLSVSNSNSCNIDQIILIPQQLGISFDKKNPKTVLYDIPSQTLKIKNRQIFTSKSKEFSFESIAKLEYSGTFGLVDLSDFYNNDGIGTPQNPANFDNLGGVVGAYLPQNEIDEGIIYLNNVPFYLKTIGMDNIRCDGQVIVLPEKLYVKKIYILAAANHGDYNVKFTIDNSDYELNIHDWCNSPKDIVFDYRYISSGEKQYIKCGIDTYVLEINDFVSKIILPQQINVHIFALTIER